MLFDLVVVIKVVQNIIGGAVMNFGVTSNILFSRSPVFEMADERWKFVAVSILQFRVCLGPGLRSLLVVGCHHG